MMMKALKKMNAGLTGAKHANSHHDILVEETGSWNYLVIDPAGIRTREEPSYSKETKKRGSSLRFKEGEIVHVERRRRCGWTRWLGLSGGAGDGWLFDVSPKDKRVRMIEVDLVIGNWQYEACVNQVPILSRPVARLATLKLSKGDQALELLEVVSIKERMRPLSGKGTFLRLADDRGWVLDYSGGRQAMRRWALGSGQDGESLVDTEEICISIYNGDDWERELSPADFVPLLGPDKDQDACEYGMWNYMVVDRQGISLRSTPVYNQSEKLQRRVEEGEIVTVMERRPGDGTTFLRLASPAGWAFDVHPKHGKSRMRMLEVKVEHGLWYYRIVAETGIALRSRCTFMESAKIGKGPLKGSLVTVTQRVKAGETTFLRLKEENGWIFDIKNGRLMADGPVSMVQQQGAFATITSQDGTYLLSSPTNQKWALTRLFLIPGSRATVLQTCEVENIRWAKVSKNGGSFEGWVPADRIRISYSDVTPTNSPTPTTESPRSAPSSGLSGELKMLSNISSNAKVIMVSGPNERLS